MNNVTIINIILQAIITFVINYFVLKYIIKKFRINNFFKVFSSALLSTAILILIMPIYDAIFSTAVVFIKFSSFHSELIISALKTFKYLGKRFSSL